MSTTTYITHHIHHQHKETITKYQAHYASSNSMNKRRRRSKPKQRHSADINADEPKKPKGIETVIILCNFGAPFNNRRLNTSYYGHVPLQEYDAKLKEKFNFSQDTQISFIFDGLPLLGRDRERSLEELGIMPNDTITAQTNGINLVLKAFDSPNYLKCIEMFKHFTLQQLREQIKMELGIQIINQKALICPNWRIIDDDAKCKDIEEYETITVLKSCHCELKASNQRRKMCATHSVQTYFEDSKCPIICNNNHKAYFSSSSLQRINYSSSNTVQYHPLKDPIALNLYRERVTTYAQPLFYSKPVDEDAKHPNNFDNTGVDETSTKFKICRYGDRCRYFNNPHISGPCRYYHPPPISNRSDSWKAQYGNIHHGTSRKNKYHNNYTMKEYD